MKQITLILLSTLMLHGCSTAVAVTDVAVSTTIYAAKTTVNVVDAVTPDIINDD